MKKLTPILIVDAIEPCLNFWVERLGFKTTVSVPLEGESERLGFAILVRGELEVMLQARASVEADDAGLAASLRDATSVLYLEVSDIDALESRLAGLEVVVPRRKTFYGATEIFVREPGGHIIGLSQQSEPSAE